MWLTQFDRDEFSNEEAEATAVADYEAKIAALECKGRAAHDRVHSRRPLRDLSQAGIRWMTASFGRPCSTR